MARFTLTPSPEPVRNAFVPLRFLQEKLNLAGRANALFTAGTDSTPSVGDRLTLEDWGLIVRTPKERAETLGLFLDEKLPPARQQTFQIALVGPGPRCVEEAAPTRTGC